MVLHTSTIFFPFYHFIFNPHSHYFVLILISLSSFSLLYPYSHPILIPIPFSPSSFSSLLLYPHSHSNTCEAASKSVCVNTIENTACDRELSAFIWVAATVRDLFPSDINSSISLNDDTASLDRLSTYGPRTLCSRTFKVVFPLKTLLINYVILISGRS